MERTMITHEIFSIPLIETHIAQTAVELEDYAQVQGVQDGQKERDVTELEMKVKLMDYVQGKGQSTIDFIKENILMASHVVNVKEFEQSAVKRCEQAQLLIDDKLHQVKALERERKFSPDPFKMKHRHWLLPLALFVGIADGIMAYSSFRSASYSTTLALVTSFAITLIISGSHILYAGWIMASAGFRRKAKIVTVLLAAITFFYGISTIRAQGINNMISIAIPNSDGIAYNAPHVSQLAIAGISLTLFAAVLFLSLVLWMTKEERVRCQEYKKTLEDIKHKKNEIAILTKEIAESQEAVALQKRNARVAFDYLQRSIIRVKNIVKQAIAAYKRKYANFHSTVPEFFRDTPEFEFDESIHFLDSQK